MSNRILKQTFGIAFGLMLVHSNACYATGPQQSNLILLTPGTGSSHSSSSSGSNPGHGGLGSSPSPPASSSPNLVPYTCGSSVSSQFIKNSLYVKSDQNGDAGFKVYSSQSSSTVAFAPGVLSFNVSGAQNGDQIEIFEFNVNGVTNGRTEFLNNGAFSIDLTQLTTANIKQLACVFATTNSTIVLSNFNLSNHALPLDMTQTAHCSTQ
ncbi:MAG TPA: hypothetical protein V6C76_16990 [Drouetiella sp.]